MTRLAATLRLAPAFILAVTLLVTPCATPALAGPYADALGKCLVDGSTPAEKTVLVRWMFAMMALHPDVQSNSSVTPDQRAEVSKQTARLFERLLTEACATETREAIKYEGASTLESAFSLLGQVAARELFSHPKVNEGLAEFSQYIDEKKLAGLADVEEKPAPAAPASGPPK